MQRGVTPVPVTAVGRGGVLNLSLVTAFALPPFGSSYIYVRTVNHTVGPSEHCYKKGLDFLHGSGAGLT